MKKIADLLDHIKYNWDEDEIICNITSLDWSLFIGSKVNRLSVDKNFIHYGLNKNKDKVFFFSLFPFNIEDDNISLFIEDKTVFKVKLKNEDLLFRQEVKRSKDYDFSLFVYQFSIELIEDTGFVSIKYLDCNKDYISLKKIISRKEPIGYKDKKLVIKLMNTSCDNEDNKDFLEVLNYGHY